MRKGFLGRVRKVYKFEEVLFNMNNSSLNGVIDKRSLEIGVLIPNSCKKGNHLIPKYVTPFCVVGDIGWYQCAECGAHVGKRMTPGEQKRFYERLSREIPAIV